jgi:hypothetical protein
LLHQLRATVDKIVLALPPDSRQAFERSPVVRTAFRGLRLITPFVFSL